jgi:ABC-type multidrug transport system ATPase subunit
VIAELSLEENLIHAARISGNDPDRVANALRVVGLDGASDRKASDSSFGMLRRTEIARLLLTKPTLLLLDEAVSGLDNDAQALVDSLVDRTLSAGGSAVLVSHDVRQLDRATLVYRMASGALQETL